MSKRAVDFAFNKFPFRYDAHGDVIHFEQTVLLQGVCRIGYMQAEKDLALTWEDIRDIEQIINQVRNEYPNGIGAESFGEEVLRRFNESRRTSNE